MSTEIAQLAEANRNRMLIIVVSKVIDFLHQSMPVSSGLTPSTNDHYQVLASILWHNYWFAWIQQSVSVEIEINFCCI